MIVLSADKLEMGFGGTTLFSGATFQLDEKGRMGFVGANGSGKTTLFKILKGELIPENGGISKAAGVSLGYMEQHTIRDDSVTLIAEALTVFARLEDMELELEELHDRIDGGDHSDETLLKQAQLTEKFQNDGGLVFRGKTASALVGLGFVQEDFGLPVSALSGGQRSKLQLAKLLLSSPDVLLLDEPTNHLDIESVDWLERLLIEYKGAFIVISHDRYFLDRVTTKTMALENGRLSVYNGGYSDYVRQRDEELELLERHYENDMKEVRRMEDVITELRRWNKEKSVKRAESKQKALDKMKENIVEPPPPPDELDFTFRCVKTSGNDVLFADGLALSFDGKMLFKNASLDIKRREIVFIIGPNGCGKTSLFRILTGQYKPDFGEIRFGSNVEYGYFDQLQGGLDLNKTVIDQLWDYYPKKTQTEIRCALAAFLFTGDDVFKEISALSGGERARLALLKIMLSGANLLMLDEPTNHLDISSREALEAALSSYEGTLLIVSHDRFLINKLADRIYELLPDKTICYGGNYDYYLEHKAVAAEEKSAQKQQKKPDSYRLRKEHESAIRRSEGKISRLEASISELEEKVDLFTQKLSKPEFAADYEKAYALSQEIDEIKAEIDEALVSWEEENDLLLKLNSENL